MTLELRHQPRCIKLGTTSGNIYIALIACMVAIVQSARTYLPPAPTPKFLPGKESVTVREGGVAILPCSVLHLGTKKVSWRRLEEDRFLTIGKMTWTEDRHVYLEHSRMQGHVSNWNLVIKHVRPKDAGIYECQVSSRVPRFKHVQLKVVGPPISKPDSSLLSRATSTNSLPDNAPNLPVTLCVESDEKGCLISITGRKYVDLGDKIELMCKASGGVRVADEMDWFKGGDKIDSDKYSHVIIEKYKSMETRSFNSILIIERSSLNDTGDYICRSSRNDIASLKVTVLHAETANKRRGTERESQYGGSKTGKDGDDDYRRSKSGSETEGEYRGPKYNNHGSSAVVVRPDVTIYILCLFCAALHLTLWHRHQLISHS